MERLYLASQIHADFLGWTLQLQFFVKLQKVEAFVYNMDPAVSLLSCCNDVQNFARYMNLTTYLHDSIYCFTQLDTAHFRTNIIILTIQGTFCQMHIMGDHTSPCTNHTHLP